MFFRLSTLCLLLPVLLLAGCSSNKNAFAPACPRAAILADAADLLRYRDGGGRDLTDLVLSARILGVSGDCKPGETSRQLATQMQVTFEVTRGPAMGQRDVDMMLFVAVSDQDQILDKKLFPVHVVFPSNVDTVRLTTEAVPMLMPISPEKSGAAYALTAGFQLTPEELDLNRSRPRR